MAIPFWIGIPLLLLFAGFLVFAFRQGMQVKNKPEGVPPERIGNNII
jgi:TM2 domain-containing membrane protein YozV